MPSKKSTSSYLILTSLFLQTEKKKGGDVDHENKNPEPEWHRVGKWMVAGCRAGWQWDASTPQGGTAQKYFAGSDLPNHPGGRCLRPLAGAGTNSGSEPRGPVTPAGREPPG
jgi:hypothetical protein